MTRRFGIGVGVVALAAAAWAVASRSGGVTTATDASNGRPAEAAPSPGFIGAALRDQVDGRGASLAARYTVEYGGPAPSGEAYRLRVDYIWTPRVVVLAKDYQFSQDGTSWASRMKVKVSYDSVTGRQRRLQTGPGGTVGSLVDGFPLSYFSCSEVLETGLLYLSPKPLWDQVKEATVQPETEDVDGSACWRLEISGGWRIWCDPAVGFCPRRIELVTTDPARRTQVDFRQYQQAKPGLWFPSEMHVESASGQGTVRATSKLAEIHVDEPVSPEDLEVQFPPGTRVFTGEGATSVVTP